MTRTYRFAQILLFAAVICLLSVTAFAESVLTLPQSLRVIEAEMFYGDTSLDEVVLPEGIEEIGSKAFAGSSVKSINLPSSITSIADDAFEGCSSMFEVCAEYGSYSWNWAYDAGIIEVEYAMSSDFEYEIVDEEIVITKYIGSKKTVLIPDAFDGYPITKIGFRAFLANKQIEILRLPKGLKEIGQRAFSGCSGITGLELPDSLEVIREGAFSGCIGLTSVEFPDSVTCIENDAFYGCVNLSTIGYPRNWAIVGPIAYISPFRNTAIRIVEIPDGVDKITWHAFAECSSLESVVMPNTVKEIEDGAFYGCENLQSVLFSNSLEIIGYHAFNGCKSLSELCLPDTVKEIGGGCIW